MRKSIIPKLLVLSLAFASFLPYVACSSQQNNAPAATTTGTGTTSPLLYGSTGQSITSCSRDPGNFTDLNANFMTYSAGGSQNTNWIRVKFSAMPAAFMTSTGYLAFFVWTTDGAGNQTTPQLAQFFIERYNGASNFQQLSNSMGSISWPNLQTTATSAGIATTSLQTVAANITYVVQLDINNLTSMTVIQPAFYYSSLTTPDHYVSALIPNFYANPNVYAQTHSMTQLQLHPFYSNRGSGYTEAQFSAMGQALCF